MWNDVAPKRRKGGVDRTIRAGDGIVCRVNGTSEHYVIGTVVSGEAGALLLRAVSDGRTHFAHDLRVL